MRALKKQYIYTHTCRTEEERNSIVFVQLASMQQPWRSIRVVVLRFVHKWIFNGVSFHSVLHCRYEYTEERKGGDINYQVVERRDTVNAREGTERGKRNK